MLVRLENAAHWLKDFAPDEYKISLLTEKPAVDFKPEVGVVFSKAADALEKGVDGEELQKLFFSEVKATGLKPQDVFVPLYRLFFGKDRGPKVGPFLVSLDKGFAVKRLRLQG